MKYPKEIKGYTNMDDLANDLGNLRYDILAELLGKLSKKIEEDSANDFANNRPYLSSELFCASQALTNSTEDINKAWYYCKRNMNDEDCE